MHNHKQMIKTIKIHKINFLHLEAKFESNKNILIFYDVSKELTCKI